MAKLITGEARLRHKHCNISPSALLNHNALLCSALHAWHCWNKEILKQKCDASLSVLSAWSNEFKIAVSWETKKKMDWDQTNTSVCFTIDQQLYINIFLLAADWQKKFNGWYRSVRSLDQLLMSPISLLKPVSKPRHDAFYVLLSRKDICNNVISKYKKGEWGRGVGVQEYMTVAYMSNTVLLNQQKCAT